MSDEKAVNAVSCCASCGISEIDDIKLKECDDCDLVKYCSDECRKNHKLEHEEDCKKRAAELRDELLFKQPESSHLGDCPICSVPLPIDSRFIMFNCCSKRICRGCISRIVLLETEASPCPFCRTPEAKTKEEQDKRRMKRVEANDPVAMCQEGVRQYDEGDYRSAVEYLTKAAELGDMEAHYRLSILYHYGKGVEKDRERGIHHAEEAAIGGHPDARFLLGKLECGNNDLDRAVKHWIIAATQGDDESIKMLMKVFKMGYVEKEVLAAAFRAHKAAVDATKSRERELEERISSGKLLEVGR